MIRILQIVPNMHSAGLENLLMNIYRNLDRNQMQFDFLVHYSGTYDFDDEIRQLGGKIHHFPVMEDKHVLTYYRQLKQFFKEHPEYKVIHGHMPSLGFLYMHAAKAAGVPVRIMHSHNASAPGGLKGWVKGKTVKIAKYPSTHLYACSQKAGVFQYGKSEFQVQNNAIDADKFRYNPQVRQDVRHELGIKDETVWLHIGRFTRQKNHPFLLEVFAEYHKREANSVLLLMGAGERLEEIRQLVQEMGLTDCVRFLGVQDDAWRIYQGADVFLLPSLHEGLPVVGIEAQAAGLPVIMSDEVTEEVDLTGNVAFWSLQESPKQWAQKIQAMLEAAPVRRDTYDVIVDAGYDICHEASRIQQMYTEQYEKASGGNV